MRDKVHLEDAFELKLNHEQEETASLENKEGKSEAIQALVALGYSNSDALKAISQVEITPDMDAETILKASLKKIISL